MAFTTYRLSGGNYPVGSYPNTGIDPLSHSIIINHNGMHSTAQGFPSFVRSFSVANGVTEWVNYYVDNHAITVSQHCQPIFDGFGGFYLDDYQGNGLHHFSSTTGVYNGKSPLVIFGGGFAANGWRAAGTSKRVGAITYIAVLRCFFMASFTYDGTTLSRVGLNTAKWMGNSINVKAITLKPNSRIYSLGPTSWTSSNVRFMHCAWGSSSDVNIIDMFSAYGISDARYLFYNDGDDSVLICHAGGIVKVDADVPTTIISTLATPISAMQFASFNTANGVQSDGRFMVCNAGTYTIIDATTLSIVNTYDGLTFDHGLIGAHEVTYLYPEVAIFRRDPTFGHRDTITYVGTATPPPPPEQVDSIATLSKSIGGVTLSAQAVTVDLCPISGRGGFGTVSGFSSVPPGTGQIVKGRDDVQLACDA